jgi:hypothetical protein
MTPSAYKEEYEKLAVHLGGGLTTPVKIWNYRCGDPADHGAVRDRLRHKVAASKGVTDFEIRVGLGGDLKPVDPEFTKTPDFDWYLRMPFKGKGTPEHCQIVLQLAHHYGMAPDLQKYADDHLGLDCNGFVGNFLLHVWKGQPWTDHCMGEKNSHREGPDQRMDGFEDKRKQNRIFDWDAIQFGLPHIFIRTEDDGKVIISNSGDLVGHIVISEPGVSARRGRDAHDMVRIIESTATHNPAGLSDDWYSLIGEKKIGSKKIFKIDRGGKFARHRELWFTAFRVNPEKV